MCVWAGGDSVLRVWTSIAKCCWINFQNTQKEILQNQCRATECGSEPVSMVIYDEHVTCFILLVTTDITYCHHNCYSNLYTTVLLKHLISYSKLNIHHIILKYVIKIITFPLHFMYILCIVYSVIFLFGKQLNQIIFVLYIWLTYTLWNIWHSLYSI